LLFTNKYISALIQKGYRLVRILNPDQLCMASPALSLKLYLKRHFS
jgi:hypothetical protein